MMETVQTKNSGGSYAMDFAIMTIRSEMYRLIDSKGKSLKASHEMKMQVDERLKFIRSLAGNLNK